MKIFTSVYDGDILLGTTWLNNCTDETETKCTLCDRALGWSFPLCDLHLATRLGLEVKPSKVHNLGLFTVVKRKKGDALCPLAGELRSDDQLNALYSHNNNPDCVAPYCVRVANKRVDAFRLRYAWVYMNHSDDEVNCEFKKDAAVCLRDIEAGEELIVNYGPAYHFKGSLRFEYTVKEDKTGLAEEANAVQESLSAFG